MHEVDVLVKAGCAPDVVAHCQKVALLALAIADG